MKEKSNEKKKKKKKDYQAKSMEKMLSIYLLTIKRNQRLLLEYLWTILFICNFWLLKRCLTNIRSTNLSWLRLVLYILEKNCEKSDICGNFINEIKHKYGASKRQKKKKELRTLAVTDAHRHNGRSQNMQIKCKDVKSLL